MKPFLNLPSSGTIMQLQLYFQSVIFDCLVQIQRKARIDKPWNTSI